MFSKCLLRHDVVRVFVSSLVLVLYRPFCHGALKHDISTLFTTFFVWTSLQFIFQTHCFAFWQHPVYNIFEVSRSTYKFWHCDCKRWFSKKELYSSRYPKTPWAIIRLPGLLSLKFPAKPVISLVLCCLIKMFSLLSVFIKYVIQWNRQFRVTFRQTYMVSRMIQYFDILII